MNTVHGGLEAGELRSLGLRAEEVLDFSANINPLGISPRVQRAAAGADLSSYPDRHSLVLREGLAERLGVDIEMVAVGNGSNELIHLLTRALHRPGTKSLIFGPTFGEYRTAVVLAGGRTVTFRATAAHRFRWSMDQAIETIERTRPALAFLCNPNNPTGVHLPRNEVQRIQEAVGPTGMLILDDAYASLADHSWDTVPLLDDGHLGILRSMTKDHALAGVRIGYLVAEPDLIREVRRIQPAWSVNAVAQAVGLAALQDDAHVEEARRLITASKARLQRGLTALGIPVEDSATNFLIARVGKASRVRTALLRRRMAVRDCASFGLPDHIRIAVRRPEECALLLAALEEVMGNDS